MIVTSDRFYFYAARPQQSPTKSFRLELNLINVKRSFLSSKLLDDERYIWICKYYMARMESRKLDRFLFS